MPVISTPDYRPLLPFRSGHFNTIFPALFRHLPPMTIVRERLTTPDDDFLDMDYLRAKHGRVAFLLHGLEGNSASQYIRGAADIFFKNGWDVAMINHRSCSGEINRQRRLYHSGVTDDPHTVVQHLKKNYDEIIMIGFSLGGNMTLKYLGEQGDTADPAIKCAVAVSVPIDLHACSLRIIAPANFVYNQRFLASLRKKIHIKHRQFPDTYDPQRLRYVKNLWDFDEHFTAPIHGFGNAIDYYTRCSSLPLLKNIRIPTLLINALDDPMLGPECYPFDIAEANKHLHFMAPRHGGHCGFVSWGQKNYWQEWQMLAFVQKHTGS
ncbi:MAG TPA: alpha/beta fold hydrolase [Bacteroidetes bacterium]|nr:alpha/beta fold hydrolase [Bacteroidota bacterium]